MTTINTTQVPQLLDRAANQVLIAEDTWRFTLRDVLNDLIAEVMQKNRDKEYWKREFYKQDARATRAEQISLVQEARAVKAEQGLIEAQRIGHDMMVASFSEPLYIPKG